MEGDKRPSLPKDQTFVVVVWFYSSVYFLIQSSVSHMTQCRTTVSNDLSSPIQKIRVGEVRVKPSPRWGTLSSSVTVPLSTSMSSPQTPSQYGWVPLCRTGLFRHGPLLDSRYTIFSFPFPIVPPSSFCDLTILIHILLDRVLLLLKVPLLTLSPMTSQRDWNIGR